MQEALGFLSDLARRCSNPDRYLAQSSTCSSRFEPRQVDVGEKLLLGSSTSSLTRIETCASQSVISIFHIELSARCMNLGTNGRPTIDRSEST